jgi:CRP/FNR family transcriptional regulator
MDQRTRGFIARLLLEDRAALMRLASRRSFKKGGLIFSAGGPADSVCLLESGYVKIYHLGPASREVLLWFCFPGDIFGLSEMVHGGRRQVYARAGTPVQLLSISREAFKAFLTRHPSAAVLVMDVLSHRVRALSQLVQGLITEDVPQRLMQLLSRLSTAYGRPMDKGVCVDIQLTHQEMANMIGTSRQSITSTLNALKRLGLVAIKNRRLHLLDARLIEGRAFSEVCALVTPDRTRQPSAKTRAPDPSACA